MCADSCNIGITAINRKSSVLDFFNRSFLLIYYKHCTYGMCKSLKTCINSYKVTGKSAKVNSSNNKHRKHYNLFRKSVVYEKYYD